jgi:hypothetical protein
MAAHEHNLNIPPKEASFDPSSQMRRVENLWTCFTAMKSWMDMFFSLDIFPVSTYPYIPFSVFTQLAHAVVVLFRLSTFESPNIPWDCQKVIQELNFREVLKRWKERWETVPKLAQIKENTSLEDSPWDCGSKTLLVVLNWWDTRVAPKISKDVIPSVGQDASESVVTETFGLPENVHFDGMNIDLWDDSYFRTMLESGFDSF